MNIAPILGLIERHHSKANLAFRRACKAKRPRRSQHHGNAMIKAESRQNKLTDWIFRHKLEDRIWPGLEQFARDFRETEKLKPHPEPVPSPKAIARRFPKKA